MTARRAADLCSTLGQGRSSRFTTFAGIPATTQLGSTSSVTTAPAATTEFAPTVTPARTVGPHFGDVVGDQ